MCFHRRLVFGCAHHAWLGITRPCETEASFDRGETDTGCSVRWSHGYDTIRVQAKCRTCIKAQEGTSFRLGIVKEQLKALKEHLALIKGEPLETVQEEEEKEKEKGKGKEKNGLDLDAAPRDDGQSGVTKGKGANASPSSSPSCDSDDIVATLLGEEWLGGQLGRLDEVMEEVRVDPKHRTLKLPSIVAARMETEAGH
ncbi:hypothetical protein VTG60DRAFT_3583 [Thermothelomyces hinnuleus]